LLACSALCYSQSKDNQETNNTQQQPATEQRGTESAPLVIKIQNPSPNPEPQSHANTNTIQNNKDRGMNTGDKIAIAIGVMQFTILLVTVIVMIVNGRRQLRAYVLPESVGIGEGNMMTPPQPNRAGIPGCYVIIKNGGQTPAYNVVSWFNIAVIRVANENRELTLPPIQDVFALTLGSGGTFSKALWFDRALAPNEIADIGTGERAIYMYGRVEYMDAFKKRHFTNCRLRYTGLFPPVQGAILNFSEKGNDAN
jgi:hypothetical protein